MAYYLGRERNKEELTADLSNPAQLAGARASVLSGGKADGVKAIDVTTGSGLQFLVLPGRGMDIPEAFHK